MQILIGVLIFVVAYGFGTFPSAAIVAGKKNLDITKVGSGNPGASNVIRNLGWKTGLAVFLMDMAKAALAVGLAWGVTGDRHDPLSYLSLFAAILGHSYPITRKFKGGKGVACGGGGMFGGGGGFQSGRIGGKGGGGGLGADMDQAFSMADLDQKPRAVYQPAPVYPAALRSRKIDGVVTVIFVVDANGRVANAKVEKSSDPAFDKPALDAVRKWKFEPAMKEVRKVSAKMRAPIRFDTKASS